MGAKQSSQVFDGRTRAYSSSDLPSGNSGGRERISGLRYTNGPDGPRIRYTAGGPNSSGLSIPAGGRSGSHNQSLDGTDEVEGQLPPDSHRLLIGSLPAQLSPRLLGGKAPARNMLTTNPWWHLLILSAWTRNACLQHRMSHSYLQHFVQQLSEHSWLC